MMAETKKILDPKIKLTATCVRVPVFIGHSEAVNIEFEKPITADEARDILREAPGCLVIDKRENGGYVTPIEVGRRVRHLSSRRIREDPTIENGLSMWVVSDNLRKGAALNAVQIAELLHRARPDPAEAQGRLIRPHARDPGQRGAGRTRAACYADWVFAASSKIQSRNAMIARVAGDFGRVDQIIGEIVGHLDAEFERPDQPPGRKVVRDHREIAERDHIAVDRRLHGMR